MPRPDTLLAREGGPAVEAQFLISLSDGTLWPVELTREDYARAGELVLAYQSLSLGTTDASVIAVCERLGLVEVATLDRRHFTVVRPRHIKALTLLPELGATDSRLVRRETGRNRPLWPGSMRRPVVGSEFEPLGPTR